MTAEARKALLTACSGCGTTRATLVDVNCVIGMAIGNDDAGWEIDVPEIATLKMCSKCVSNALNEELATKPPQYNKRWFNTHRKFR